MLGEWKSNYPYNFASTLTRLSPFSDIKTRSDKILCFRKIVFQRSGIDRNIQKPPVLSLANHPCLQHRSLKWGKSSLESPNHTLDPLFESESVGDPCAAIREGGDSGVRKSDRNRPGARFQKIQVRTNLVVRTKIGLVRTITFAEVEDSKTTLHKQRLQGEPLQHRAR